MKIIDIAQLPLMEISHNPRVKKQTILKPLEIEHITLFSIAYFPPGEVADAHVHPDMVEIFMVRSGTGVIRIGNDSHVLISGRCVVVAPNELHEIENTGREILEVQCLGVRSSQAGT